MIWSHKSVRSVWKGEGTTVILSLEWNRDGVMHSESGGDDDDDDASRQAKTTSTTKMSIRISPKWLETTTGSRNSNRKRKVSSPPVVKNYLTSLLLFEYYSRTLRVMLSSIRVYL